MCKISRRTSALIVLGVVALAIPLFNILFQDYSVPRQIYKYVVTFGILFLWVILLIPTMYFIYMKKRFIKFLVPYAFIWLVLSSLILIYFILNVWGILDYVSFTLTARYACGLMVGKLEIMLT